MSDLLQKLEDRVVALVEELETTKQTLNTLRPENQRLSADLDAAKNEGSADESKLQGILSLLEDVGEKTPA